MIKLKRKLEGQSLILVAFGIFAFIGLVGLAVDLGLVYVERIRIRRAADAAALAAASELPLEGAAHVRALEYLQENNYPCGLDSSYSGGNFTYTCNDETTRVEVNGGYGAYGGTYVTGPDAEDAARIIRINTVPYRDNFSLPDSAARIEVAVTTRVELYFMRVLGFNSVPVAGRAVGENINDLDIVLVFDRSTSMEFDTLCYGCWTPNGDPYPEGDLHPLPWNGPAEGLPYHCSGDGGLSWQTDGHHYVIIEAEEYSYTNVSHDRDLYTQGMSYWVMQRNGGPSSAVNHVPDYMKSYGAAEAYGRDAIGSYMSHHPFRTHMNADGQGLSCTWSDVSGAQVCRDDGWVRMRGGPYPAPRLDYVIELPTSGTWYVWVRGIGGDDDDALDDHLMWGVDGTPIASVNEFEDTRRVYDGADHNNWRWRRMGSYIFSATPTKHTLNIWAGAPAGDIDRIIVTTDPSSSLDSDIRNDEDHIDNNRTDQACNPCDVRFGGYPNAPGGNAPPHCVIPGFPESHPANYRYEDWLYDDEQPIRGAIEASKKFAARLDPRYDQIGLVAYSTNATIVDKLQCVRRLGHDNCTKQVITDTVITSLDGMRAGGGTNIPDAIQEGITVLSNQSGQYGRPGAAHIMVLMTDGESNQTGGGLDGACDDEDYWPYPSAGGSNYDRSKDCAVYYARIARNNGIVIYTITIGKTADVALMEYIAELTGGIHRNAPRPEQLDPIFEELYRRIFLRLVE